MTRETKIGLLVGTAIILVIGIFVSHYLSKSDTKHDLAPLNRTATDFGAPGDNTTTLGLPAPSNNSTPTPIPLPVAPAPTTTMGPQVAVGQQPLPSIMPPSGAATDLTHPGPTPSIFDTPTTQPAPRQTSTSANTVKIEAGDTLGKLAAKYLGSAQRWSELLKANDSLLHGNPKALRIGMVLTLPATTTPPTTSAISHTTPAPTHSGPTALVSVTGGKTYVVLEGDTLSSVARKTLGSANKWELLFQANQQTLGNNPSHLKVGMSLVIPSSTGPGLSPAPRGTATPSHAHPVVPVLSTPA